MKKRFTLIFVVLTLLLVTLVASVSAQEGPGWWIGATMQNVGTANATLVVTAYDSQTSNQYTLSPAPLAPGASITVLPNGVSGQDFSPSLPSGFIGSIVASSDQPIASLVNVTNREAAGFGVSGGTAAAIYEGVSGSQADTEVRFPLVKHNHFGKTTTFYLQNAGSNAATISVVITKGGVNYPYTSPSVAPGQMVAIDPGLAGVPATNGTGSLIATSAEPIAGIMLEHEHSASVATVLQASSGFTTSTLDDVVYCPSVKVNHFGRSSGVQVQNNHIASQRVRVVYNGVNTANTYTSAWVTLAPGASTTFLNDSVITSGSLFSAKVEGENGPVAAIVNESEIPLVNPVQTSVTYACQAESTATTKVSFPGYKENRFGRTTALQVQNVGASAATNVVLEFTDNNGLVRTTQPQTISAGASATFLCVSNNSSLWNGTSLANSTISGVIITSDQPVIAIANEASWSSTNPCTPNNGSGSFDKATASGFNLTP
ncbi:MAG: hypothetical protein IPJ90_00395 [Anaerolineaceae bacterium]|nr:hypothetical protein [Anaerolineaceae bacterium]